LGNTYEEIAFEKAGIIKDERPLFTAVQLPGALKVIEEQAKQKNAPIYRLNKEFFIDAHEPQPKGELFSVTTEFQALANLEISMIGKHQTENATLAIMTAQYLNEKSDFSISEQAIRTGLKAAYWPGRFEIISENPLIIIDGAHNDEGVTRLTTELAERYPNNPIHVVFAALKDKKLDNMIARLDQVAEKISFVSFDYPRAAAANDLLELSTLENKQAIDDWKSYLPEVINTLKGRDLLVITGSLYFISEIKPYLFRILTKK